MTQKPIYEQPIRMHSTCRKFIGLATLCLSMCNLTLARSEVNSLKPQMEQAVKKRESLKTALEQIEKTHKVTFVYSPEVVNVNQMINYTEQGNQPLTGILDELLSPLNIKYEKSKENIVLTRSNRSDQERTVIGTVKDQEGSPLIGVSVIVKDAPTEGTSTDENGKFSIEVKANSILNFRYVGFRSLDVPVNNQARVDVVLQPDEGQIEEVVVVGYGSQKRTNLTSAIASISGKDLENVPVSNISNAMGGRLTGVFLNAPSGLPGQGSPINIRGASNLTTSAPIYVIDNIVRSKADFDNIDPQDIGSLSILKDAASAAVYGARGGNGVVLVTTKRGGIQKPTFNYSGYVGVTSPTSIPQRMTAYEHATYTNNGLRTQNIPETDARYYTPDELATLQTGVNDFDWYDEATRVPVGTQHNISVNGGSDKIRYFSSLGYYKEQGLFTNTDFDRVNFRSNVDAQISNALSMNVNIDGNVQKYSRPYWPSDDRNSPNMQDFFRGLLNQPPQSRGYVNGLPDGTLYHWHPIEVLENGGYRRNTRNTFNGTFRMTYDAPFLKGLQANASINYNKFYRFDEEKYNEYTLYRFNLEGDNNHIVGDEVVSSFQAAQHTYNFNRRLFNQEWSYQFNAELKYSQNFGKHFVNGQIIYEQFELGTDNFNATGENPISTSLEELWASSSDPNRRSIGGGATETGRMSVISRFNYAYDDRYLFEMNFRYDGSSAFAPDQRFGFFPSVSAGWRISEESFFKDNFRNVNNLKLRGSFGTTGNDQRDGAQIALSQWYQNYVTGPNATTPVNAVFGDVQNTIYAARLANPFMTWEKIQMTDIGMELGMWNGLLSAEVDYFYKHTYDILDANEAVTPATFGIPLAYQNSAIVDSWGWEFSLGHNNKIGNFNYFTRLNFSYNDNVVKQINEAANALPYQIRTGRPVGFITGFEAAGVAQTAADLENTPLYNNRPFELGDIVFIDQNGDGIIDARDNVVLSDHTANAQIQYGLSLGGSYKGFDFNVLFQGVGNRDVMFSTKDQWGQQNPLHFWTDAWTPENTDGAYPKISGINATQTPNSSFWLMDGRYTRLKFVELGYSLPQTALDKLGFSRCRIYVSGNNLFTWGPLNQFHDPEFQQGGNIITNADGTQSADYGAYQYPIMKSMNIGVNIGF